MTKNCTMILSELGPFVFDNENELIYSKKFKNIISSNILISNGDYSEILDISDKLRNYDSVFSNDTGLIFYLRNNGINVYGMPSEKIKEISKHKLNYLIQAGFAENERDAHIQLRQFALDFSSSKVRRISEKLDLHISQSINALDELDKIINVIGARLREWYGLHFPELDYLIQNIFTYAPNFSYFSYYVFGKSSRIRNYRIFLFDSYRLSIMKLTHLNHISSSIIHDKCIYALNEKM